MGFLDFLKRKKDDGKNDGKDDYLSQLQTVMQEASKSDVGEIALSNGELASKFMKENNQPWEITRIKDRDFIKLIEYSCRVGRLDYANGLIRNKKYRYLIDHGLSLSKNTICELVNNYPQSAITGILLSRDVSDETKNKLVDLSFSEEFVARKSLLNNIMKKTFVDSYHDDEYDVDTVVDSMFDLFMYNDVPNFLKRFKLYQYAKNSTRNVSPFEIDESDKDILCGLFLVSVESGEKSLKGMAKVLIDGEKILGNPKYYINGELDFNSLSKEEIAIVLQYSDTMVGLHNISCSIKGYKHAIIKRSEDRMDNLKRLSENYDLPEKLVTSKVILNDLFSHVFNVDITPEGILENIETLRKKQEKNELAGDSIYKFVDLTDDRSVISFRKILQNGLMPKALDILQSNTEIPEEYKDLSARDFLVSLDSKIDPKKTGLYIGFSKEEIEASEEKSVENGVGSLMINHIVATKWNAEIAHELAISGICVPVKDLDGNILFSKADYDKIRTQEMQGLSYYGTGKYALDPKCKNINGLIEIYRKLGGTEETINGIKSIAQGKEDTVVASRKKEIVGVIRELCEQKGIKVVEGVTKTLLPNEIELIETGSTKRGTNMPGDGDFDFAVKTSNYWIRDWLNDELSARVPFGKEKPTIYNGDLRSASVRLLNSKETVDVDVSYSPKSLAFEYSPDECVEDRLKSIQEQYPDDINYVKANIVLAKAILKKIGVYKKAISNGGTPYGGLGGIGVENWILQNGGSFEQAMRSFEQASVKSNGKTLEHDELMEQYPVYEYGNNHMTSNRTAIDKFGRPLYTPSRHGNYTYFITENGISAARSAFGKILGDIEQVDKTSISKFSLKEMAPTNIVKSIFAPKEIIDKRPEVLTCYPNVKNMMFKYDEIISDIIKKRSGINGSNYDSRKDIDI